MTDAQRCWTPRHYRLGAEVGQGLDSEAARTGKTPGRLVSELVAAVGPEVLQAATSDLLAHSVRTGSRRCLPAPPAPRRSYRARRGRGRQ